MGAVKVVLNDKGVRDLLRSKAVADELERRARKIADAADAAANEQGGHSVNVFIGKNRARAEVATHTPRAMAEEATRRTLSSSLDAGRG